ncbi:MAG: CNP1-like family protein [Gammaproteobacteria bacterium]|nr:CNP1-like family protein [Gammaproteobacteria bacterium]
MPSPLPLLIACALLLPGRLLAQVPEASDPGIEFETRGIAGTPAEPWQEETFEFPPYPEGDGGLLPVPGQSAASGLEVYLDPVSIRVGRDGVTRYTVVLVSPRGARNVLFEGLRCSEVSYRVYAFADAAGEFIPRSGEDWRRVHSAAGAYGYRKALARDVLCDQYNVPRPRDEVIARLRYPSTVRDERDY